MLRFSLAFLLSLLNYLTVFSQNQGVAHTNDDYKYRVKLIRTDAGNYDLYDTLIPLSYLIEKTGLDGVYMPNFEYFQGFDYLPLSSKKVEKHQLILFNDSVRVKIESRPFNREVLKEILSKDKNYYLKNKFFGVDDLNLTADMPSIPENILSRIRLEINDQVSELPNLYYSNLFGVNLTCPNNECPSTAYVTDDSRILLKINGPGGAGFYYAIFIFNDKGKLEEWVFQRVI